MIVPGTLFSSVILQDGWVSLCGHFRSTLTAQPQKLQSVIGRWCRVKSRLGSNCLLHAESNILQPKNQHSFVCTRVFSERQGLVTVDKFKEAFCSPGLSAL